MKNIEFTKVIVSHINMWASMYLIVCKSNFFQFPTWDHQRHYDKVYRCTTYSKIICSASF